MSNKKQIGVGAIISYIAIIVNIVVGLVYTPWMIKQIGKSQYGLYTLANSLITLFLMDFGLSSAAARYVSNYNAAGQTKEVNNFLGVIYKFYIIVDFVIFVALTILFFFIDSIYVNLTSEELQQFKVVYIIAASFNIVNLPFVTFNGILTAYEKFIQLKLADLIYRALVVGLTVTVLMLNLGLYALVAANAVAGLLIILYKFIVIKTTTDVKVNFKYKDKKLFSEIFGFSFWTTVLALATRLIFNITPTILGIVANSAAIAVFGVITQIEGYSYTITTAINGMFMPTISKIYAQGENVNESLMPLMIKVGRFQFALNGLIIVGFSLVGKSFINLWVGADYIDAYYGILLVIIPGIFFNSLQVANTAMTVMNKVKVQAIIGLICGVVNIVISVAASKFYGVIGASVSISIAYFIRAILYVIVDEKIMHFDMRQFILKCYLRMSPMIIVTLGLGILINYFIADGGWLKLILKAIAITAIYLVLLVAVGLSKSERKNIFNKFTQKLRGKNCYRSK